MSIRLVTVLFACVFAAAVARADTTPCDSQLRLIDMEPNAAVTHWLEFPEWAALAAPGTISFTRGGMLKPDANPAAMLTALSVEGKFVKFKLVPNQGCGTPGCRNGNTYFLGFQPTTDNGDQPTWVLCLKVRKTHLQSP